MQKVPNPINNIFIRGGNVNGSRGEGLKTQNTPSPLATPLTKYNALYKSIFQYGLLVWSGCSDNAIKPIEIQQNHAVRLCLKKKEFYGSTSINYNQFRVLPVRYLYRQFTILFKTGKITIKNVNKREKRGYDLHVSYIKKKYREKVRRLFMSN